MGGQTYWVKAPQATYRSVYRFMLPQSIVEEGKGSSPRTKCPILLFHVLEIEKAGSWQILWMLHGQTIGKKLESSDKDIGRGCLVS